MQGDRKKSNSTSDILQACNFFEELCWMFDSNKGINFKNSLRQIKELRNLLAHSNLAQKYSDEYNLIGILPSLLKDEDIFQSNSELVNFANEVLLLKISRWEKRSRNEIIGLIICEVEDANKERINTLTKWSIDILKNKTEIKKMQDSAKSLGNIFSWNETIQKLVASQNE